MVCRVYYVVISCGIDSLGAMSAAERENTAFIKDQRQQTKMMISQQDVQLDALGQAVDRLDNIGRSINVEIKDQNRKLDDLDRDMTDAEHKMNFIQAKLSKLLKTKDGCQIWTIVILAVVLVVLVALVIFV